MTESGSWLCPTDFDRARVLDNNERVRRARGITLGVLGLALVIVAPWAGWWLLGVFAAALLNFVTFERRIARSEHPERVVAFALIYTEVLIGVGVVLSGAGQSPLLPWMVVPLVLSAARFRREVITAGMGLGVLLMLLATVAVDPASVFADPTPLIVAVALAVAVVAAAAAIQAAELHHRGQSVLDPLTGLLNRKALASRFAEIEEQAGLLGAPVCMIALDLDTFKRVNDEHGHERGDAVLRDSAYEMRKSLRDFELLYRYGGDEFLALLPGADLVVGRDVGERLRAAVESSRPGGLEPTVSVGVAVAEGDAVTFESMFAAADAALYEAKRAGRNRVVVAADLAAADPARGEVAAQTRTGQTMVDVERAPVVRVPKGPARRVR
ncbi:MAG: GGDEF domain-containing protein [bacterium]